MRGASCTPCTLTIEQAAKIAGCTVGTMYHHTREVITRRTGRKMLINEASLMAWIRSKTREAEESLEAEADRILARNYRPTA